MPSPHQQALAEQLKHIFGEHAAPKVLADAGSYSYIDDGDPPTFFPFGDCQLPDSGRDPYEDWFGRNNADAARAELIIFLMGGDGFMYALWRYDEQPVEKAPVVYLDDEGSDNSVVARNLKEFLQIAATGVERVAPGFVDDASPDAEPDPFFLARGIRPARDPSGLLDAARAAHPDFDEWLSELTRG